MRNAAQFVAGQSESPGAGLLYSILHAGQRFYKVVSDRMQVARLTELDDRMLADIGLTRGDVDDALHLPLSNDPGRELQIRATRNIRARWGA